jgi:hypothetical protein
MTKRFRRSTPKRTGVIVIAAVVAMVGGVILGVATTHSKSPVGLSAGENPNCDSAAPSQGAAAQQNTTTSTRIRHAGWIRTRHGWRHRRPPAANPSAAPSGSADPSAAPSDPAEPSAAPSDSAAPSAAPSDSAAPPCPSESPGDGGDASATPSAPPAGPVASDFIDIRQVNTRAQAPTPGRNASRGTFVSRCGTNANKHNNPDNYIVTPGVPNGAQHTHDYVGNLTTDNTSTDQSLAAGGTTCANRADKSAYFWPLLRDITNAGANPGQDGNNGTQLRATSAVLQFRGNAQSKVVAMPQFLRIITGNAKSFTQNGTNAKAAWGCTGTNRVTTDKYPLCPRGSQVTRTLDFPSCWDGQNLDSANHRTHVVFPDAATGACPANTKAIPQLRDVLTYRVPSGPNFAVDSFPAELHKPITDHADFENVMSAALMNRVVSCINGGRRC